MDHLAAKTDLDAVFARLETQIDAVIARLETQIDAAFARLETKIAETNTKMWRIAVLLLVGQAILPAVAERLLEKL